jgi:NAD-dependent deacetylase
MTIPNEQIKTVADLLRQARFITALTGAGVSKESGVPTFRDALEGLWARFDPTQLATRAAFQADPKLVWDFYEYRREIMRPARPNPGHLALAALERRSPGFTLITQNVDDLHEQAGSQRIIRLHGRIAANKCSADCRGAPTPVDVTALRWDASAGPPPCPQCGAPVRPDVVWFGEMLPPDALAAAHDALLRAEVMLVIGTSGLVSPAADMPVAAQRAGATVIEINPDSSMISRIADHILRGPSGEVLPRLLAALEA